MVIKISVSSIYSVNTKKDSRNKIIISDIKIKILVIILEQKNLFH